MSQPQGRPRRHLRGVVFVPVVGALLCIAGAACVDLFHSTDFKTLCSVDAAACASEEASIPNDATPDALSDGGTPLLDFCTFSRAQANEHAQRACAWLGACNGAVEQSAFGACMARALPAYDCKLNPSLRPQSTTLTVWNCLATVTSCDAVTKCLYGGRPAPTCAAALGGAYTVCSNEPVSRTVVQCALPANPSPPVAIESCVLEGRTCAKVDESRASCAGKKGITCTGQPTCDGTFASECKTLTGVPTDIGVDCTAFGSGECKQDDAGAACAPIANAASCTGSSGIACDDAGVAKSCVGGKTVAFDCSVVGLGCSDVGVTGSLNPMAACTELDASARCSTADECAGDTLRSCAQGKRFEVSCSEFGLQPCAIPAAPRDPFAACGKP